MRNVNLAPAMPTSCPCCPPPPCLVCGQPSTRVDLYYPSPGSPAAAPPGKSRLIIVRLCDYCASHLKELAETIEDRVVEELRLAGRI